MTTKKRNMSAFTFRELMHQIEVARIYAEDGALSTGAVILRQVSDELAVRAAQKAQVLGEAPISGAEGGAT